MNITNSLSEKIEELEGDFAMLPTAEDKYTYLIDIGKALEAMPQELHDDTHKVKGCQSNVWLAANANPDGTLNLQGDSDALIVKGLVALVVSLYSGQKPNLVLGDDMAWLSRLGLQGLLSPTRNNGLSSMIKQIRMYAFALGGAQSPS